MPLQIKKSFKQDPVKLMIFRTIKYPTSSGFALYGKTNSGKSVLMLSLASKLHDKYGFKVWDLWGGKRNQGENLYWTLPSPYKKYWAYIKKRLRLDEMGIKQYKVNLAYPITREMPTELPHLKNDKDEVLINPKPFTIPITQIDSKQIRFVLNNVSDSDVTLWEDIRSNLKKSDGLAELHHIFEKRGKNTNIWKNFFHPLIELRMLGAENDENVLDIKKEAKDRDSVFVLVLHHVPEKFRLFVLGWIMYKMWDLMNMGQISGRNCVNIREATEFFRASEKSAVEDRYKRFKIELTEFIRQARGRLAFILDAQSVQETAGLVSGSFDLEVYGRTPGEDDRKIATDQLKRDGKITPKQISDLGELEKGEYYFVESGKEAKKRYCLLPPCDFWRESDQNFYSVWTKRVGIHAFKDYSALLKDIDEAYRLKIKELREIDKEREEKRKLDEEERARKEEAEQEAKKIERERRFLKERAKIQEDIRLEKKMMKQSSEEPVERTIKSKKKESYEEFGQEEDLNVIPTQNTKPDNNIQDSDEEVFSDLPEIEFL